MILSSIGEVGIHVGNDVVVLRPSLYAMTQIGDPAYIVEVYANVMADNCPAWALDSQFSCAYEVLLACTEQDVTYLIGSYVHDTVLDRFKYEPGLIPKNELLHLARCLLRHGVTGDVEPLPPEEGEEEGEEDYVTEFKARSHVANAVAHLGMSEKEAWTATMTGLTEALRSKFPPVSKDEKAKAKATKPPTSAEYDATMEWADKIEAKRKLRLGIKD